MNGELAPTAQEIVGEVPAVLPSEAPVITSGREVVTEEQIHATSAPPGRRLNRIRVPSKPHTVQVSKAGRFLPLARWEGVVTERYATYFAADVIDLDTGEEASVEFELNQVKPGDIPLCEPGSLFYWSVGYQITPRGQRKRSNYLRFRRIGSAARG